VGWAIGAQWAAFGAGAGILCLVGVVAVPDWVTGPVVVAAAFVAEVAVAHRPNWALVVVGAVLLACFLACSEVHENRIGGGWLDALHPHWLPVLACAVAAVIVAAVSTLSIGAVAVVALVAVGGAVCVALLLLAGTRS
jgi:hypothetical protein